MKTEKIERKKSIKDLHPLSLELALNRAHAWWNGLEIEHVFQSDHGFSRFLAWMGRYGLGRKRIFDTPPGA